MADEEREVRMALSAVVEPGDPALAQRVAEEGVEAVWRSLSLSQRNPTWSLRARALDLGPARVLARQHGMRFVIPSDDEWPQRLSSLAFCEAVQGSRGEPLGLWVIGEERLDRLVERSVAVVGSRASSAYGDRVASELAAELSAAGVTVVSGGAYGIDAAAHRGSLANGGPTVAVLAGGLDVAYPRAHEALLASVARSGALVSEALPGETPTRRRFLTRNRLIAALAAGTVIVEAALRSGARNTVTWAGACGRPVMAVPGPVGNATSATPHRLIRDGEAVLVSCVQEVLEGVAPLGENLLRRPAQDRLLDVLSDEERAVYEALPARGGRDVGDLALRAGVVVPTCLSVLAALADRGLAECASNGGWRLGSVQDRPLSRSADEQQDRRSG